MKVIAKTKGAIQLLDIQVKDLVTEKPSVVTWTQFKESRAGKGQIKTLASNLPDTATDAEFQKFLAEAENEELAVAAFVSKFEEPKEEAPKKTRRKPAAQKTEE